MTVIVMYDVDTGTKAGKKRLPRIADRCLDWGIRVQDSVYECEVNAAQLRAMTAELSAMIDPETDSLRFYDLGNHCEGRITVFGKGSAERCFVL